MLHGSTIFFAIICLGGAALYVIVSSRTTPAGEPILAKVLTKGIASTSFVALAFLNGAAASSYGRAILAALILSWMGDILLVSRQSLFLLAGITAFLFAHIAFTAAFAMREVSTIALALSFIATGLFAVLVAKWLWNHLVGFFVIAVPFYLAAVMVMVSMAIAASALSLPLTVALAAVFFAASDISVARDRFVQRDVINKAWGLPLYYLAQVLFAASVAV